ncbi:MAG: dihydrofolate reductase family protein [Bacteriodetes bacterium]|nr:dihydrofolate reductase family protein [Bacteroidota bacterium]
MRKVVVYIATSADGFIAKPDNDLSFLEIVQREGEDYGYASFMNTIDTILMGRKTYDWVLGAVGSNPHAHLDTYVLTRTPKPDYGKTRFYTRSIPNLIANLKAQPGKNIFCDGGAEIVHELLSHNLIDEFIVSVVPVFVGNGIPLFKSGRPEQRLTVLSVTKFESGLVQIHYSVDSLNPNSSATT